MQDLTTGSVTRHLLKTTSFMLVTMVFQTLYFLADLYWVGRLGKEAVAGVAVAGNLTFVVLAATQMLSVGTTTLVSHAAGRKDQIRATFVFNQSMVLGFAAALLFFVSAMSLRTAYAAGLSADAPTARLAADYLAWFIPAMSLQFPLVSMSAALRATGNFKPGMVVQTSTVVINIVLAPILIFGWPAGPALGVAGAAIASFIAIVFGTIWLTTYFRGAQAYLHIHPHEWRPRFHLWGDMLKVGLPAGAEFALMAIYVLVVYVISRPFGSAAQAGFGVGLRILQACFLPVVALGIAVAPVAGQNFGARLGHRVRETFRSAALMASAMMIVLGTGCAVFSAQLIAFFNNDPEVVAIGAEYLRIAATNFVASGVVFVTASMFQAMGNTVPPLVISVCRVIVTVVPIVLLARLDTFRLAWVWYIAVAGTWLQMFATVALLHREFRRRLDPSATPAFPEIHS